MPSILEIWELHPPETLRASTGIEEEEEEGGGGGRKKERKRERKKCSFTSSAFKPFTVSLKMFVTRALIAHHTPVLTKCTGTS